MECFVEKGGVSTPIEPIEKQNFQEWFIKQPPKRQEWIKSVGFNCEPGTVCILSGAQGEVDRVILGYSDKSHFQSWGGLRTRIPSGIYSIDALHFSKEQLEKAYLVWALDCYKFDKFKSNKSDTEAFQLEWSDDVDKSRILQTIESIYIVRDLINRPANDLNPETLAHEALNMAKKFKAKCHVIVGKDLLKENFPMVHAVGKASSVEPRLIDMVWGNDKHPKVTLVGKGVTFDSGGINIKPDVGMKLMKKDMGGAAHVLGLAHLIMSAKLPVRLRVIIPAVENAVSGNGFRPLDVIPTRIGKTVEIGHTDAEGRLILCDALALADEENPDLIIDCATLTGAARVAMGTDIVAMFSNRDDIAKSLIDIGLEEEDHVWQLPLYTPYNSQLQSNVADLSNIGKSSYGGAIIAALYLNQFLKPETDWVHLDMMAWNIFAKPGRPEGGEAQSLRTMFRYIEERFC